jgi:DNA-binding MarR family transcriptional regulator
MTVRRERPEGESAALEDVAWWDQILALHATVEQDLGTVLRRHGLSVSEYRALALLAGAPEGELRMLDLADALNLNQSSVSRLVGRLESADLVRRETCGDDRRGVFTVLTDTGTGVLAGLVPAYRQALTAAVAHAEAKSATITAITKVVREAHRTNPPGIQH